MTGGGGLAMSPTIQNARWTGRASILEGWMVPQWIRYLILSSGLFGVQLVWSCEMAQVSPYLLSLGLSKALMSAVFVAGPLSGLIVQPVVGLVSDKCKSNLGRRRPFIIGGCCGVTVAILLLGWAPEVAAVFVGKGDFHSTFTIILAVISVFVIDFAINAVQAMDRSLLVDVIPSHLQAEANAWASRVNGFGMVFGYWIGGVDLVYFTNGWLGNTQLKVITVISALCLCVFHAITVVCVQERVLVSAVDEEESQVSIAQTMLGLWSTFRSLPRPILQVFQIQFFSWIGWFPFLFFSTSWIAEKYTHQYYSQDSDLSSAPPEITSLATRAGTQAMFWNAIICFLCAVFVPFFVSPLDGSAVVSKSDFEKTVWAQIPLLRWLRYRLPIPHFTLPRLWMYSNGVFASLLMLTFFSHSVFSSSFLVAVAGFCWAVTNWAPFSLLGDLILRLTGSQPEVIGTRPIAIPYTTVEPPTAPIGKSSMDQSSPMSKSRSKRWSAISAVKSDNESIYFDATPNPDESKLVSGDERQKSAHASKPSLSPWKNTFGINAGPESYKLTPEDTGDQKVLLVRNSSDNDSSAWEEDWSRRRDRRRSERSGGSHSRVESYEFSSDEESYDERHRALANFSRNWESSVNTSLDNQTQGSDQAGAILGCHNVFIVLPQFLVTAISTIIFAIIAPNHSVVSSHGPNSSENSTTIFDDSVFARQTNDTLPPTEIKNDHDALGMIFRLAGVAVLIATFLSWRMQKEWREEREGGVYDIQLVEPELPRHHS